MANRTKFTKEKKDEICKAILETGNVSTACVMCGVSRTAAYAHKNEDKEFSDLWEESLDMSIDLMEAEARRRAVEGVLEPVFYQGQECGLIRKYSDTLLMFLLKGNKPDKFRDNQHVTLAGDQDNPISYKHDPAKAAQEIIKAHGKQKVDDENE